MSTQIFYLSFVCYYSFVKEIRVVLLAFFTLIAARMMGELPTCPGSATPLCGHGLIILILYLLSTYFVDSLLETLAFEEDKKKKAINLALCIPYICITGYVVVMFLTSISVVTIEYILSLKTVYAAIVYAVIYFLNTQPMVRKLNMVFMVTFILSFAAFMFI